MISHNSEMPAVVISNSNKDALNGVLERGEFFPTWLNKYNKSYANYASIPAFFIKSFLTNYPDMYVHSSNRANISNSQK